MFKKFRDQNDNKTYVSNKKQANNNLTTFFTVPYVCVFHLYQKNLKKFFKNNKAIRLAYVGLNKFNSFIKTQKDKLTLLSQTNVMYRINYQECESSYAGRNDYLRPN